MSLYQNHPMRRGSWDDYNDQFAEDRNDRIEFQNLPTTFAYCKVAYLAALFFLGLTAGFVSLTEAFNLLLKVECANKFFSSCRQIQHDHVAELFCLLLAILLLVARNRMLSRAIEVREERGAMERLRAWRRVFPIHRNLVPIHSDLDEEDEQDEQEAEEAVEPELADNKEPLIRAA